MSKGCDEHGKVVMVFLNRKYCFGHVSYVSGVNWPAIDNFDNSWFLELELRNLVMAGTSFIYKGISSSTTVNKAMSLDMNITTG